MLLPDSQAKLFWSWNDHFVFCCLYLVLYRLYCGIGIYPGINWINLLNFINAFITL